ncbi:MAG: beta-galactosidase [Cellulosilyticaceae bacterium]
MIEITNKIMIDNKEVRIMSGAIHYFRMVKEDYKDRLLKLKACGFNTVETYVAWNIHEPNKGDFVFDGHFDLDAFIQTAAELVLYVIVRPGPYICAEWDFGGFPAWLLEDKNMQLRCFYEPYLKHVDTWFDALMPHIVPYLHTNGGPVIAVQVENEYGSYGDDKKYLEYMRQGLIARGVDVPLFTSDGSTDYMLTGGTLPNVFKTANFGGHVDENFDKLLQHQPNMPLMCMEFWDGWFDHWGVAHHTRESEEVISVFEEMLARNAHVNFYMFHGGTNFGFMNGANFYEKYNPTATSYDYCALLTEAGDITPTYLKVRETIEKHFGKVEMDIPANSIKKAYGKVTFTKQAKLFENLENLCEVKHSQVPLNMEALGQNYGYIFYRKQVEGPREKLSLKILNVHDRAQIFLDDKDLGIYSRDEKQELEISIPKEGAKLEVLVENLGRVNYGAELQDYKGITKGITIGDRFIFGFDIYNLEMNNLEKLSFTPVTSDIATPSFYQATFEVDQKHDTFLKFEHLTKGFVLINGFNIGRYWNIGPQETLYVPSHLLKEGTNELVIFEQHGAKELSIEFVDTAILG